MIGMKELLALIFFPGATSFILYSMLAMRLERKTLARIHGRIGPLHAGPKGILQTLYDFLKVLGKQLVIPKRADKLPYLLAPQLMIIFVSVAIAVMPIRPRGPIVGVPYSMLFAVAVFTAIPVLMIIGARSSANKYATMGGVRSAIQFVGFEVAKIVTVLSIAWYVSSWNFEDIVARQVEHGRLIRTLPLAFITLIIIALVETERPPFDNPEAEPEVAFGLATEYSSIILGFRVAFGYILLFAFTSFITVVFLGGNHGIAFRIIPEYSVRRFILKVAIITRLFFLLRGGLLRYRPDQAVRYGRRIALLLAYINLLWTAYLIRY